MESHQVEASPRALARVGGVPYLITIVVGIFNEAFVKGRIVVPGDATPRPATASRNESLPAPAKLTPLWSYRLRQEDRATTMGPRVRVRVRVLEAQWELRCSAHRGGHALTATEKS